MSQTRTVTYCVLSVISISLSCLSAAHRCDHFKGVNGGVITYDPDDEVSLAQNTVAVLRCRNGDVREAICTDQGWEPASLGECRVNLDEPPRGLITRDEPRSCVPLTNIENGFVTYSPFGLPPYKSGTVVNLICNLGFAPVGSTTTKCENGNWGHLGLCQPSVAQQCPPIPEITNGQISYIAGGNGPFGYGAVAELTCTLGSSVIGNNRVSCEPGGWGPFPGLGKCEEITKGTITRHKRQTGFGTAGQCPALLALNGQVNYIQSNGQVPYSSGTTAMLVCNAGYMPSGSTTSYCSGSVWSPTIGQCTLGGTGGFGGIGGVGGVGGLGGVNCLGMGVPLNGQLSYTQGGTLGPYPSGTSVTVMCNPGFTVSGTPTAVCTNG
ncbi:Protein F36H2.3 e [Aphelenchoides avenae]|nr:Protein F36H2.3 e [Aphelenchus avenae]